MLKRSIRLALVFVALHVGGSRAFAQTASATLVWDQSEPVATVQAYQTFVKIGAANAAAVTPTCVTKVQAPNLNTECTVPLASVPAVGTQVTITESNGSGLAATTITQGGGPGSPVNVKITIIVTVP